MKKKILLLIVVISIMFCFGGCSSSAVETANDIKQTSMFVEVENTNSWKVVYHKDTKVMYAVSDSGHTFGVFTLLVNPDGTPMLYEE